MPLDLLPPRSSACSRDTLEHIHVLHEDDYDDEAEKETLARYVPRISELRALLEEPEETLAYMRKVQASIPDPDSALDSLVKVYEDRVERRAKERELADELAYAAAIAEQRARETARPKKPVSAVDRTMLTLQPHFWKVVYGVICCWGLVQLALTR